MLKNNSRLNLNLNLFICLSLFVYVCLRAFCLSFTIDEAISYSILKGAKSFKDTANHHLLNTWLMAICSFLFGYSELSLRLPNVLVFLLYLFFVYKILRDTKPVFFLLIGIPLLFFNPFLFDFFSLARGYGLSLGFMVPALYFTIRKRSEYRLKEFLLAAFFAGLALLSNLSLINFYIALLILFFIEFIFSFKENGFKKNITFIACFLIALIPLLLAVKRLVFLKEAGELYFGNEVFEETLVSLIERSFYFSPYPVWFADGLRWTIKIVFLLAILVTLYRKDFKSNLFKIIVLISLIVIGLFLEHVLFGALYPVSRTGIYFLPLYGLFLYYFFLSTAESLEDKTRKVFFAAATILISVPITFHFISKINLLYTFEWKFDAHTKEIVEKLLDQKENEGITREIMLGNNWIFEATIHYYIETKKAPVKAVRAETPSPEMDYFYDFSDNVKSSGWKSILTFEDTKTTLYSKKN